MTSRGMSIRGRGLVFGVLVQIFFCQKQPKNSKIYRLRRFFACFRIKKPQNLPPAALFGLFSHHPPPSKIYRRRRFFASCCLFSHQNLTNLLPAALFCFKQTFGIRHVAANVRMFLLFLWKIPKSREIPTHNLPLREITATNRAQPVLAQKGQALHMYML